MNQPTNARHEQILADCERFGIETDVNKRWEDGIDHHPKSHEVFELVKDGDWLFNDDRFCWKQGGDGDNGEDVMYSLDIMFELKDARDEQGRNQTTA